MHYFNCYLRLKFLYLYRIYIVYIHEATHYTYNSAHLPIFCLESSLCAEVEQDENEEGA